MKRFIFLIGFSVNFVILNAQCSYFLNVSNDTAICKGDSVSINAIVTGGTGPFSYTWFPASFLTNDTISNTIAFPDSTTTFFVTVKDTFGCQTTDSLIIYVDSIPPSASYTISDTSICSGLDINVDASSSSNAYYYQWILNGANPSSLNTVNGTFSYSTGGNYDIELIVFNGCGSDTLLDTSKVNVIQSPTISFSPSDTILICRADSVLIQVSGANNYTWSPGTGLNNTSGDSVYASPLDTTLYQVVGITNACTDTAFVNVIVLEPNPVASFIYSDTIICRNNSVLFDASSSTPGVSYSWTFNGGSPVNSTDVTESVFYSNPGIYGVTLIISNSCSSDTLIADSIIKVLSLPTVSITPSPVSICSNSSTGLTASGASTYVWSPSNGLDTTQGATVIASPSDSITYLVVGTDTAGCVDSATVFVQVLFPVNANFTYVVSVYDIAITNISTNADNYFWTFGDGSSSTLKNPNHHYDNTGTFDVCLFASNNCFIDTLCSQVQISGFPSSISENTLNNVFTLFPNPAQNFITLNFNGKLNKYFNYSLSDITGRTVISGIINKKIFKLDLKNLDNGLYFLNIIDNNQTYLTKKIIISK